MKSLLYIFFLFGLGYALVYYAAKPVLRRYMGLNFVICFALTTAAGFLAPNAFIFMTSIIVIFIASVRNRMEAICRYVLMIALVPTISWQPILGSTYLFSIEPADALGFALLIAVFLKPGRGKKTGPSRFSSEDMLVLVLFLIVSIASSRPTTATLFLRSVLTNGIMVLLPFWAIRRSVRNGEEFGILIAIYGVSTLLLSTIAIYEARHTWSLFDYVSQHLDTRHLLSKNAASRGGMLRSSVTMATPLNLACYISLGIVALACTRRYYRSSVVFAVLVGIAFLGLLAPQSRGNLICVVAGLFTLAVAWRKWGYAALAIGGAFAGGLAVIVIGKSSARVAAFFNLGTTIDVGGQGGQYYDYRQLLLHRGLEEGMKHPIIGTSLNDVLSRLVDITQGEHIVDLVNFYLSIFLVSGIVGLFSVFALFCWSFKELLFGFPRKIDPTLDVVRAFAMAGLVIFVIELGFMSFIDRMPYMLAFVLVATRLAVFAKKGAWKMLRAANGQPPAEAEILRTIPIGA